MKREEEEEEEELNDGDDSDDDNENENEMDDKESKSVEKGAQRAKNTSLDILQHWSVFRSGKFDGNGRQHSSSV